MAFTALDPMSRPTTGLGERRKLISNRKAWTSAAEFGKGGASPAEVLTTPVFPHQNWDHAGLRTSGQLSPITKLCGNYDSVSAEAERILRSRADRVREGSAPTPISATKAPAARLTVSQMTRIIWVCRYSAESRRVSY